MEPSSSSKSAGNTPKTAIATKWRAYIQRLPPDQRPVVIQEVQQKKPGVVDHTYTDFSKVPCPTEGYVVPKKIIDMSFPQKVYHILCQSEYDQTVCWMPHGRAFKVRSSRSFEVQVCPQYFGHASIFLFKRELLKHGFKSITRGQDRNCRYCYNVVAVKGLFMCKMRRQLQVCRAHNTLRYPVLYLQVIEYHVIAQYAIVKW